MAETKQITALYVVTDSEQSYDEIGDIDGGEFDKEWLKRHVANHGTQQLLQQIAWMNFQVFEAMQEVNSERNAAQQPCEENKPKHKKLTREEVIELGYIPSPKAIAFGIIVPPTK